jgi:PhoPQ-activated pathogenicity-related protein
MRPSFFHFANLLLVSLSLGLISCAGNGPATTTSELEPTPLDVYVKQIDPNYEYNVMKTIERDGLKVHQVEMISQQWLDEEEVDRTLWHHWLMIYEPPVVESTTGMLFISGGSNNGEGPELNDVMGKVALETKSIVSELRMVPNEPLDFKKDDMGPRTEDEIIAYGWKRYLESGDPKWASRLPMTKSAVRAMDTISAVTTANGDSPVYKYFVAGGSKRGWTTWTTAAVDPRVVAIAPIVIDLLNVRESFMYHYRMYGFWAPAVGDYYREGIMDEMDNPKFAELMSFVDPYSYRERLTMPKLILNATGDQFFLNESSRFYYDELKGEKNLRYVPNVGHDISDGSDALETLIAFYQSVLREQPRPEYDWTFEEDGSIRVKTGTEPKAAHLLAGTNPKHRDFRIDSAGPVFESTRLEAVAPNTYVANVEKPESGFTAYFVELTFEGPEKYPLKLTTAVRVTPEGFQHPLPVPGETEIGPEKLE